MTVDRTLQASIYSYRPIGQGRDKLTWRIGIVGASKGKMPDKDGPRNRFLDLNITL